MKRNLCAGLALIMLLTACSAPAQVQESSTEMTGNGSYGVYEFTLTAERVSGWPFGDWNFVYTYHGEEISSGHQIRFPLELFSFHPIRVDAVERDDPENSYSTTFPVAICDGGVGKTEITVTDSEGHMATFEITCQVTQVGKQ